ncbi:MAG: hypothetical protein MI754_07110 [Chromatiales bacterium]|nr:hypothetical protein [Chromatiales bacterium]
MDKAIYCAILVAIILGQTVFAGEPPSPLATPTSVPVLGEAGLLAAAIALGIIGAKFIHKMKK